MFGLIHSAIAAPGAHATLVSVNTRASLTIGSSTGLTLFRCDRDRNGRPGAAVPRVRRRLHGCAGAMATRLEGSFGVAARVHFRQHQQRLFRHQRVRARASERRHDCGCDDGRETDQHHEYPLAHVYLAFLTS